MAIISMPPSTADGRPLLATSKADVAKKNFFTHDWTDPTTWYEQSVRVTNEVATDSGDHLTYNLAHVNVIDSYHGKLYQEDWLKSAAGATLRVAVTVNDVAKTEQDPHFGTGGDFTVNYALGKIVFLSALAAEDVVKVTYSYATNSRFTIKPDAGKTLMIDFAEVQFSADVQLTDTIKFQPYGYVDVFAPQYLQANGGPYAPGTLIPLGNPLIYKSMTDFQAEATRAYPTYPALGGNGWRGTPLPVVVLDWDYVSATVLRSDYGMEIRVFLEHDTPFNGWYGTATFYCTSM